MYAGCLCWSSNKEGQKDLPPRAKQITPPIGSSGLRASCKRLWMKASMVGPSILISSMTSTTAIRSSVGVKRAASSCRLPADCFTREPFATV